MVTGGVNKNGRPTKLTQELQDEIVKVVRNGNYIETAAHFVGLHKSTIYDWMKRGAREKQRVNAENGKAKVKKSEQPYVEFSDALEKAMAHAEIRDVTIIGKAAETQWQAAAWRLERKFPDRWGRKDKQQLEHTGKDGGAIETEQTQKIDLDKLTEEELESLENIIARTSDSERS